MNIILKNTFAQLLFLAFPWVLNFIAAKYYSTKILASLSLGLSMATPIFILSNLQMRNTLSSSLYKIKSIKTLLKYRIFLSTIALCFCVAISKILYIDQVSFYLIFSISLWKFCENLFEVSYGIFQKNDQLALLAKSIFIKYFPIILILIPMSFFKVKIEKILLTTSFYLLFVFLVFDLKNIKNIKNTNTKEISSKDFLISNIGLTGASFLAAFYVNLPKYFLGIEKKVNLIAQYSLAFSIFALFLMVLNFACQINLQKISLYLKEKSNKKVSKILLITILLAISMYLLTKLTASFIILNVFGKQYEMSVDILIKLSLIGIITAPLTVIQYLLLAKNIKNIQLIITLIATLMTFSYLSFNEVNIFNIIMALFIGQFFQLTSYFLAILRK